MIEFISWYILISVLGWLTFPLAFRFFAFLPEKGFTLSRVLGLLIWGYLFWILTSFNILQNNAGGVLFAMLILSMVSLYFLLGEQATQMKNWIQDNRILVITTELFFLIGFAAWTIIRSTSPDILGTEKPMEMAFINSIVRSPSFPPNDPWLSGYSISYYYLGYVMIAMIIHITGTPGAVAFNLAIALVFSLIAISAFGIIYNLISKTNSRREQNGVSVQTILGALLGPIYILLVSNLEGFLELLHAKGFFWSPDQTGSLQSSFWKWLNILEINEAPSLPFTWQPARVGGNWWWRASRVLQDFDVMGNSREIIDEFPFFSFLLADLHAHVIAIPFVLLSIALCLHVMYQSLGRDDDSDDLFSWIVFWLSGETRPAGRLFLCRRLKSIRFWISALILGSLSFLNTWDFPIYVALYCSVETVIQVRKRGWSVVRFFEFIETGISLGLAGFILYLPFYIGFASQAGGLFPSLVYFTRGAYFWVMFAPLILPVLIWLFWQVKYHRKQISMMNGLGISVIIVSGLWLTTFLLAFLILNNPQLSGGFAAIQGGNIGSATNYLVEALSRRFRQPGTWLTLILMLTPVLAFLTSRYIQNHNEQEEWTDKNIDVQNEEKTFSQGMIFVCLLVLIGIGLVLAPEFFYLKDQFGWRMNTIFKFYYQAWILWGLSAAYASAILLQSLKGFAQKIFAGGWTVLMLMSLVYPYFGIVERISSSEISNWSLDGARYIARYTPGDMEAIDWLQDAPLGVVLEAVGGSYSNFARVSTFSGQPTVLGWPGHEGQWRGGNQEMGTREQDIEKIYVSPRWNEVAGLIDQYHIRYIYVGGLEKSKYVVSEGKFDKNLRRVFDSDGVIIYEVP